MSEYHPILKAGSTPPKENFYELERVLARSAAQLKSTLALYDAQIQEIRALTATYPGSFSGFANPTGLIGLTAVNGVATTAARSDATHALDVGISPVWTGNHAFNSPVNGVAGFRYNNTAPSGQYLRGDGTNFIAAAIQDADIPATLVRTSRTISTTSPLSGGGDLSADRALSIVANGISDTLLRQGAALSVMGRSANSTGDVADIIAGTDAHVLRRSGTTLGFGTIGDASITALAWGKLTGIPTTLSGYGITDAQPLDADLTEIAAVSNVRGDILITNPGPTWTRLGIGGSGTFLRSNGTDPSWTAISASDLPGSFAGFANPTGTIGLTANNGTAATAMRSDATPALSQAIVPTWTGLHKFAAGMTITGGSSATGSIWYDVNHGLNLRGATAGTNDFALRAAAGTLLMTNPTGTTGLTFPTAITLGSSLTVASTIEGGGSIANHGSQSILSYGVGVLGDSNYERISIIHTGTSAELRSQAGGTGTVRPLRLVVGSTTRYDIDASGNHTITGPVSISSTATAAGLMTASSGIAISGGSGAAGRIYSNGVFGTQIWGRQGSSYDVTLLNYSGSIAAYVPTNTQNLYVSSVLRAQNTGGGSSAALQAYATIPAVALCESGAAADNKWWDIRVTSEQLQMRAVNDANSVATGFLTVDRTGTAIDLITLGGASSVSGTLAVSGIQSNSEALVFTANGTSGSGRLWKSAAGGLNIAGASSSGGYDLVIWNASGSNYLLTNPHGTGDVELLYLGSGSNASVMGNLRCEGGTGSYFLFPRVTGGYPSSPEEGMAVWRTDSKHLVVYDGTSWIEVV